MKQKKTPQYIPDRKNYERTTCIAKDCFVTFMTHIRDVCVR